jgi:hypothetical protein
MERGACTSMMRQEVGKEAQRQAYTLPVHNIVHVIKSLKAIPQTCLGL